MNIMILDDEPKIRNGLVGLIQDAFSSRHSLYSFADPSEALSFLRSHHIDLLITDIKMPGLTGLELVSQLQSAGERFDVVILSGYSEFSYAQKAIDLKVKKYLTKPSDPLEIIRIVEEVERDLVRAQDHPAGFYQGDNLNIIRAFDFIARNYSKKFTLSDMAEELYISPTYLCRLFKKETNLNLNEYITGYRMEKAKKLLPDPELSISQIADLVGYKDANYFSALFKKISGVTPHEFRSHLSQGSGNDQ